MLRKLNRTRSKRKYQALRKRASRFRARKIARNRRHPEDRSERKQYGKITMPKKYRKVLTRILRTKEGKKALRKYRQFTGLPWPTEIKFVKMPGPKNKMKVLVGMGKSPEVQLADGPKDRVSKVKRLKGARIAATDASGRRIYILNTRPKKFSGQKGLKFVGYAPETHYVPTSAEENAGTFKAGKYWVHEHHDEGGKWPKVYQDSAGNFVYGPGTYRVGKWIRR